MRILKLMAGLLVFALLTACWAAEEIRVGLLHKDFPGEGMEIQKDPLPLEAGFSLEDFQGRTPQEWGEKVSGVKTSFVPEGQELALTFDACGGDHGSGVDLSLIRFLQEEGIAATLFINERWIHDNRDLFLELAADPLFQIENHGSAHRPLSVDGGEAWGIAATNSPEEVVQEIMDNDGTVAQLTGQQMSLFRSGTAFYDELAVEIAAGLGYEVVNFNVLGDAGATYSAQQVEAALLGAESGSIVLLHMNQPSSGTGAGVEAAIPQLQAAGFDFVLLKDRDLQ